MRSRQDNLDKKRSDYHLMVRLRRIVQNIMTEEKSVHIHILSPFDWCKDRHVIVRITWAMTFVLCFVLFFYQSYERVVYYFTYPVAVDVFLKETNEHKFPAMTICYQETKGIFNILNKRRMYCGDRFARTIIAMYPGYNASYVWEMANTTSALHSAKLINKHGSTRLSISHVALPWGICTTFQSNLSNPLAATGNEYFEIIFHKYNVRCHDKTNIFVFFHEPDDVPTSHRSQIHSLGNKVDIEISSKQVNFVNRTGHPCISTMEYNKCRENCYTKFLRRIGGCRFPFYPLQVNGTVCLSDSPESDRLWKLAESYLRGDAGDKPCTCLRKCQYRSFTNKVVYSTSYMNQSVYVLKFEDPYEIFIQERLSYDFIHLLCDIGGNSGLYVGLSLLSIFHLVHVTVFSVIKRSPSINFDKKDPLFRIASRNYNKFKTTTEYRQRHQPLKSIHSLSIWNVVSNALCLVMLLFAISNRVLLYISNPVSSLVDVNFIEEIEDQPTIVICPGDIRIKMNQRILAETKKYTNYCEIKLWELLELPGVDANHIWINEDVKKGEEDFWHKYRFVTLIDGTCLDFDVEKNLSANLLAANSVLYFRSKLEPRCGTDYQKIYIKGATGHMDYYNYRYLPTQHQQEILLILKQIEVDKSLQACVTEAEHENCKIKCLYQKLLSKINCRLPYMLDVNLSTCSEVSAAKHSHSTFIDLFLTPDGAMDCDCLPKCRTTIYDTRVYNEWDKIYPTKRTTFTFGLSHTIIETFREKHSYSLVNLLCDVGGWLGAMLGVCILSVAERMLSYIKPKYRKLARKNVPIIVKNQSKAEFLYRLNKMEWVQYARLGNKHL